MIKILIFGILYFVVLAAYIAMPLIGKLVLMVINAFITDPLPYIDEIIMFFSMGKHLTKLEDMVTHIQLHKVAYKRIGTIVVITVIALIILL